MARKHITGTVDEAIDFEEALLGRKLPKTFRHWLLHNNGKDLAGFRILPVRDERDTRKTWESLAYKLRHEWSECTQKFADSDTDYSQLLPFADIDTGGFFCFDYSVAQNNGECPVVRWSHNTGKAEFVANDFLAFETKVLDGEINQRTSAKGSVSRRKM